MRKIIMSLLFLLMIPGSTLINSGLGLAEEAKVTIIYEDAAQFELISPEGTRVLLDVAHPESLSSPATSRDILLTTHSQHPDHMLPSFEKSFPGQKLTARSGELSAKGVKVIGVASTHSEFSPILAEGGSNYIMLVEMGGLRIAHFGGIAQKSLTPEQLGILGDVDVALMQFANRDSSMYIDNLKGFNLMGQLKPKLIIPTHVDEATVKYAVKKWDSFYYDQPLTVGKADLTGDPKVIFIGAWGDYVKALKLAKEWQPIIH